MSDQRHAACHDDPDAGQVRLSEAVQKQPPADEPLDDDAWDGSEPDPLELGNQAEDIFLDAFEDDEETLDEHDFPAWIDDLDDDSY